MCRSSVIVEYVSGTRAEYEGRTCAPKNLERGDEVR
jgi:hypothetical protein